MIRPDEPRENPVDPPHLSSFTRIDSPGGRRPGFDPLTPPDFMTEFDEPPVWTSQAGKRNLKEKLIAGLIGVKHAMRGDSSYFAHAYRALLVFLTAGMIGVTPVGWCLLVLGLGLILMAELMYSAVDTLARAIGDPDQPRLKVARDIAAAAVLVAVVVSWSISITVITLKLGDYLGWWERSIWDGR
jgi:diacylglycerol kinase (ATP)